MKNGCPIGPSNLSAVCHILKCEAQLWTHTWQLDSRDFGSGQQRQRLYGSAFKKADLCMNEVAAHLLLDDMMNQLVGIAPCHPSEYLLPDTDPEVKKQHCVAFLRDKSQDDFFLSDVQGGQSLCIDMLFQSGGTLPCKQGAKRRKLAAYPSDASSPQAKWVKKHSEAFRLRGEVGLRFQKNDKQDLKKVTSKHLSDWGWNIT